MLFYTYIWRDAAGVPFYVGKGCGKRAKSTSMRSADFAAVYSTGGCTVEIVDEFILESQAHGLEVELIEKYGRREFGGLLVNKTDGGEGIVGLTHSKTTRARLREANLGKKLTPEHRAKIGAGNAGKTISSDHRSRTSASVQRIPPAHGRFKGVTYSTRRERWLARITIRGDVRHLGTFKNKEDAAVAYDAAALNAFGDDCYLNFKDRVAVDGNVGLASAP